jgi:N-carbamoyl-D-amino-acid hydrolase
MHVINVAAVQMGPIQRVETRETFIPRMIVLMDEAKSCGADLIVRPELALSRVGAVPQEARGQE